ncbi:pyridoxamine 5'-phosphate oxidase family protein [Candidatus Thioglobus autotrophicus]|nr:pyridoxamine 5'-phosphate oxidase family protein [Candidatus Thioglobus autotrophicus]
MSDSDFHAGELEAQQKWRTSHIWNKKHREELLWDHIPESLFERIENAPFFFLATSNKKGECDCSFKGGGPDIICILDEKNFVFPDIDGNGAFMSLGNIIQNPHVGCFFIDFSTGERLRVNGQASIHISGEIKDLFPNYTRAVLVKIEQVVPNCSAHIPKLIPWVKE